MEMKVGKAKDGDEVARTKMRRKKTGGWILGDGGVKGFGERHDGMYEAV